MDYIDFVSLKITRKKRTKQFDMNILGVPGAGRFFQKMIGNSDREIFAFVGLDITGKINCYAVSHIGTLNQTSIHPREIFKYSILSNSNSIIIAHNHPSGRLIPSNEDISITEKLVNAGKLIGIEIVDHLIVSESEYLSVREQSASLFSEYKK